MSDNLWQNYLNSTNVSDRSQCASDILTDSFSTETKQTYDSPTRIFFYIFKSLIDWSWEKTSDISISVKLHVFQQWKHYIRKRYLSNAPDIFSRRIWHFFRFIHIFKHISQKRLWYGFLLALKKALNHREFEKTNVRPTVKNNSKQTLCRHPVKQRTNNLQLFKCIKYDN